MQCQPHESIQFVSVSTHSHSTTTMSLKKDTDSRRTWWNYCTMIDGQNTLEPLVVRPGFTIPGITKLLIALRYYAAGVSSLTLADIFGASKSLASDTVADVSTIIAAKIKNIQMPANRNEILDAKVKFHRFCGFPLAIGAVDGTHIRIRSLGGDDAEYYRNRKTYFSMNCQLTVSADVCLSLYRNSNGI